MASPGNRRILISGVSGFTGAHLAPALQRRGFEVFGVGFGPSPTAVANREIDLCDRDGLASWAAEIDPTHVIHLAARSHVVGAALPFYETNVIGTETLLLALSDAGCTPRKVIVASSANIYGNAGPDPVTERTPVRPANHYGVSKAAMELVVRKWFDRWPTIIVRPFNYTGPGQSEAFLFAKLAAAFARRDAALTLGNMGVSRDLSHVTYIAACYAQLLDSGAESETVNLCSGNCISLGQSIESFAALTGYRPSIHTDPKLVRSDEIAVLRGDPSHLRSLIGELDCPKPADIFADLLAAHRPD